MNIKNSKYFDIPSFEQRPETYLGESRASAEKDVFKFLFEKLRDSSVPPAGRFLDVGCATGDLLAFLAKKYPAAQLAGIDLSEGLIESARERPELGDANLIVGDGVTHVLGSFDLVTCFGMLGIFDSFEPLLENLVENTVAGGKVYVQALLNPDDIDVRIAYRDHLNQLDWMRGFNIFSRERVARWAQSMGIAVRFFDFRMTSELPKRPAFPHRAHTLDLADGTRRTTNGLCLLLPETLMELHVPA